MLEDVKDELINIGDHVGEMEESLARIEGKQDVDDGSGICNFYYSVTFKVYIRLLATTMYKLFKRFKCVMYIVYLY